MNGITNAGLVTAALIVAKAVGRLDWAWWIVFSPLWADVAIGFAIGAIKQLISNRKESQDYDLA